MIILAIIGTLVLMLLIQTARAAYWHGKYKGLPEGCEGCEQRDRMISGQNEGIKLLRGDLETMICEACPPKDDQIQYLRAELEKARSSPNHASASNPL